MASRMWYRTEIRALQCVGVCVCVKRTELRSITSRPFSRKPGARKGSDGDAEDPTECSSVFGVHRRHCQHVSERALR